MDLQPQRTSQVYKSIALIAILLVSTGCSMHPTRQVTEIGFIDASMLSDSALEGNLKMNNAARARYGVEWTLFDVSDVAFDFGLGGHAIVDSEMPGGIIGVDTTYKLTFGTSNKTRPYAIFSASFDKFTEKWEPATVDYGFTNTFGFGIFHDLSETKQSKLQHGIYADYRWLHNSNGSTFHNDSFRDFFGLDKDQGPNPGYEGGMLTIGYSVDF